MFFKVRAWLLTNVPIFIISINYVSNVQISVQEITIPKKLIPIRTEKNRRIVTYTVNSCLKGEQRRSWTGKQPLFNEIFSTIISFTCDRMMIKFLDRIVRGGCQDPVNGAFIHLFICLFTHSIIGNCFLCCFIHYQTISSQYMYVESTYYFNHFHIALSQK